MPWSKHTRDDAASYHKEPTSPAAEHIAPERRYTVWVRGSGWSAITAEDGEDAANVAEQLLSFGGSQIEEWLNIEVEDIQEDGPESPQEATGLDD